MAFAFAVAFTRMRGKRAVVFARQCIDRRIGAECKIRFEPGSQKRVRVERLPQCLSCAWRGERSKERSRRLRVQRCARQPTFRNRCARRKVAKLIESLILCRARADEKTLERGTFRHVRAGG